METSPLHMPNQQGLLELQLSKLQSVFTASSTAANQLPDTQEAIKLRWLARIRWVALCSLALVFFGANFFLELELSQGVLLVIFGIGALSNIALHLITNPSHAVYQVAAGSAVILDVLLLLGLLYFCGGYTNPFSMMFLVYVTLAAVVLDARWTWLVFAESLICFVALFFLHVPLAQLGMHAHHMHHEGFSLHLHGMLVAFALIGVMVAFFVTRMNREMGQQAARIDQLKSVEDERRRLMSLATLTAGAAHELATPLATLSLISEDLKTALGEDPRWGDDVRTMQDELDRCSAILQRMRSNSAELDGEVPRHFSLAGLIRELQMEFSEEVGVPVLFDGRFQEDIKVYSLKESLLGSLRALIKNGMQACVEAGSVTCSTDVSDTEVSFMVRDSGVGMNAEVRSRAGEPFFTSKAPGKGMGLGLYLTRLFALQVGGTMRISSQVGKGTEVLLCIPRSMQV